VVDIEVTCTSSRLGPATTWDDSRPTVRPPTNQPVVQNERIVWQSAAGRCTHCPPLIHPPPPPGRVPAVVNRCSHHCPGRPPQRRQVDAVQPADAHARRARRRPAGLTRDRSTAAARWASGRSSSSTPAGSSRWPRRHRRADGRQTRAAIAECDVVVFIVDARAGLSEVDRDISTMLRKSGRPVCSSPTRRKACRSSARSPTSTSSGSAHRSRSPRRTARRARHAGAGADLRAGAGTRGRAEAATSGAHQGGDRRRPNVGKSTLVNALFGAERVIAFDEPARPATRSTSTSSAATSLHADRHRRLRRRGKVFEAVEKFSVIKTLNAIEEAHVVVLVVDRRTRSPSRTRTSPASAGVRPRAGRRRNKWDGLRNRIARR